MLKRALTAGLLALTLGVGGLLSTPSTAEAQRGWRQYTPYRGYYYDTFRNPNYWSNWYSNNGWYNNNSGYWNNNQWYPGYYSNYYNNQYSNQRYWDPYYGRYYTYDPYTGQSSWVY